MTLEVERHGNVAIVTLNRPEAMNALNADLRSEIEKTFGALSTDCDVGAIILTGSGNGAFCAGLDRKELEGGLDALRDVTSDFIRRVSGCTKPVVGAVNGPAITGGFELALACDVLVASESAWFADTHASLGIVPQGGLSQVLPRLVGTQRAKLVSLFGERICALEALSWGLVQRVVPQGELLDVAQAMAARAADHDASAVRSIKKLMDDGFQITFRDALKLEQEVASLAGQCHARHIGPRVQ